MMEMLRAGRDPESGAGISSVVKDTAVAKMSGTTTPDVNVVERSREV